MIHISKVCGLLRRFSFRHYVHRASNVSIKNVVRPTNQELSVLRSQSPFSKVVSGLGAVQQTQRSIIRNIDLSPGLVSDLKLLFFEIIKTNNWFSGRLNCGILVKMVSSHAKKILKVELILRNLYFTQEMLNKEVRYKTMILVRKIFNKIFDANIDFGFEVTKYNNPSIKCKELAEGPGGRIIITSQLETTSLESMKPIEIQIANKIYDFFINRQEKSTKDQLDGDTVTENFNNDVEYGKLTKEDTFICQELIFSEQFGSKICKMLKNSLIEGVALNLGGPVHESSGSIYFSNNKVYIVIDTNLYLGNQIGNQKVNEFLEETAPKLSGKLIRSILDELNDSGLKFDNLNTASIILDKNKRLSIEASVEMLFIKEYVSPSHSKRIKPEFHSKSLKLKQILDSKAKIQEHKGFKFLNYDKLHNIGVGKYEANDKKNDMQILVVKKTPNGKYMPVDGLPSVKIKSIAGKNFENPTNREVIEQLGFLIIRELMFHITAILINTRPRSVTKILNIFLSRLEDIKLMESNEKKDIALESIQSIKAYIGLNYLEGNNMEQILLWCKRQVWSENLTFLFERDLFIENWMPTINGLEDQSLLDFSLFSQVSKPGFLHSSLPRLPSLPKLKNYRLYAFLRISLQELGNSPDIYKCNFLKRQLDDLGDAILKKYSVAYFIQLQVNEPNFVWNMDDIHFINSNILFSKLALSYKVHDAILNESHAHDIRTALEGSLNVANAILGDKFERLVAVEYLDDPEKCCKWIFGIYDTVRLSLTAEKNNIKFLDKEKYLKTIKYLLQTSTLY